YRARRLRLAGSLLGAAIAIKLFPVLILLFFILKRSWRLIGWAVGVAALLTAAPTLFVGADVITGYLLAGPQAPVAWFASFANYSALAAGARFVTSAGNYGGVPPLFSVPALAIPVVVVIAASLLVVSARAVVEWGDSDGAFAAALCAL